MNATTNSRIDTITDNANAGDSDSDTNADDIPDYYQPISSDGDTDTPNINGYHHQYDPVNDHTTLTNGHDYSAAENGVRSLDLSGDDVEESEEEEEEDDDEEERRRAEMDGAVRRAFEEDESRRNAPLSSDNAMRVMEAMRRVSFAGSAPDWVGRFPEDRWIDQLQRLHQPPHSPA